MIQRIQTVYLLVVVILIAQVFFFPFLTFFNAQESVELGAIAINTGEYVIALTILFGIITIVAFVSIFLYRRRLLQARFIVVNTFLLIGSIGLLAYLGWQMQQSLPAHRIKYNFTCLFPLIAIIFNYLALRAIQKDEALVRSANRLRA